MDAREGEVDPLSGQRPAFPIDSTDDSRAAQYLLAVRAEAAELALAKALSRKRTHAEVERAGRRPRPPQTEPLDYGAQPSAAAVASMTARLFGGAAELDPAIRGLTAIYRAAKPAVAELPPVHPAECTSLATWKDYITKHEPVPLNHVDTFRVYKYLARWLASRFDERQAVWAWSLLLRTPSVLSGDEVAALRDVVRALASSPSSIASAFVFIVGTEYGQRDLLPA